MNCWSHWPRSSRTSHSIDKPLSPSWELELHPLGVATGNALSVTRSEDTYEKNTTCWPATAHDVTTGVPQYKCRRAKTSSAFSSSLTDLFEACKVNLVRVQFSFLLWRALARRFGSVWIHVLVIWYPMTHTTVASFVWAWSTHAMSLRGRFACIVSGSLWGRSALACPSFRGKGGSRLLPAIQVPPLPRHGGEWNRGARRRI